MNNLSHTHVAYSDESYYHKGEYSSICLITLEIEKLKIVEYKINEVLKNSGVAELKWSKMGSARDRLCAKKIIDVVYYCLKDKLIRIDAVIWNSIERKEQIRENNNKILTKMYYHLYKNVLTRRWPPDANWILLPDEQGAIDWKEMKEILEHVSSKLFIKKNEEGAHIFEVKREFNLKEIQEVVSHKSPISQVADFFSGLSSFYHLQNPILNFTDGQLTIENKLNKFSNSQSERIEIIRYLKNKFSNSSFEITFDLHRGMYTKNPNGQINFWPFKLDIKKHNNQKLAKWL